MNDRRSFFKSLAMLGAAAVGCPGIFVPKFEPVRWKILKGEPYVEIITDSFNGRDFFGKWKFLMGSGPESTFETVIIRPTDDLVDVIFHKREK